MMMVIIAFNIAVATAWPLWSTIAQREREEETLFRGLQYAEAIRVFQQRNGRYPVRLEELVEIQPRCIRQLWTDPLTDDGKWGLIYGTGGGGPRPPSPGSDGKVPEPPQGPDEGTPRRGSDGRPGAALGPITGVFTKAEGPALISFFGQDQYSQWKFTVELVNASPMGPTGVRTPRIGDRIIGRPFRGNITPPGGSTGSGPRGPAGGKGQPASPTLPGGKG